ncbi:antirestriction protein ArdA [Ectopseudomonas toyotomiensis]|uniref:antirestriction protein ArdA n=1 Tax=Ectopseudomonas toyotomiensis TaxID=554344 RepID=UPI0037CC9455
MSEHIRIYVADLAAYNAGHLHGVWINATLELDDIRAQVDVMLAASPVEGAEEYAIHDFEGFDGYSLGEYGLTVLPRSVDPYPRIYGFVGKRIYAFTDLQKSANAAFRLCRKP